MKRSIVVTAVLSALIGSTGAFAATYQLPWTKNIYNVSESDRGLNASVSVFDDGNYKCYIVSEVRLVRAMSCVERGQR